MRGRLKTGTSKEEVVERKKDVVLYGEQERWRRRPREAQNYPIAGLPNILILSISPICSALTSLIPLLSLLGQRKCLKFLGEQPCSMWV